MKRIAASLLATALVAAPALAAESAFAKAPAKAPAASAATKPAGTMEKPAAKTEPQKVASAKKPTRRHHPTPPPAGCPANGRPGGWPGRGPPPRARLAQVDVQSSL